MRRRRRRPRLRYWLFRVLGRVRSGRVTEGEPHGFETVRGWSVLLHDQRDTSRIFRPVRDGGFGFVEMATAEEAQRAISELNGKDLDGRKITVNVSNPRAPGSGGGRGPGGPRGGGRPGGGGGRGGGDRGAYGVPPSKKPFRW